MKPNPSSPNQTLRPAIAPKSRLTRNAVKASLLLAWITAVGTASAQATPTTSAFTGSVQGEFQNPAGPSGMVSSIYDGGSSFMWGTADEHSHPSKLEFNGFDFNEISPETYFTLGDLYYKNGTIIAGTEAESVDLMLEFSFVNPAGLPDQNTVFTQILTNTTNTGDPYADADIIVLGNTSAPLNFQDAMGNSYSLQLGFGTVSGDGFSSIDQFHVKEGKSATAHLVGKFTVTPPVVPVPEPSGALLVLTAGALCIFRRRR
ncbi:PEP-CTERM sorting domain-containing protein [Phragmitibacter flavus]|uniref:PEP-CTERM sorting domain-containing protein n=1 Tax=Phragmitibacter flavus TaxID=2576071 RepID=A0A5R8KEK8_9BACT|nr:choice-of-anchor K domain-containing protein [Phragmitibacter flavus]TLD70736.1 PEP-CTERM sorting domain-containing protein [Phragmitibacter flavus]